MGNDDGSAVSWGKRLPHLCTRPGSNERRVCTPQHRDVSNRSEFLQIPHDRIDSRRVGTASLASTPHTLRAAQITTGGISLSRLDLRASAFISSTDTDVAHQRLGKLASRFLLLPTVQHVSFVPTTESCTAANGF